MHGCHERISKRSELGSSQGLGKNIRQHALRWREYHLDVVLVNRVLEMVNLHTHVAALPCALDPVLDQMDCGQIVLMLHNTYWHTLLLHF